MFILVIDENILQILPKYGRKVCNILACFLFFVFCFSTFVVQLAKVFIYAEKVDIKPKFSVPGYRGSNPAGQYPEIRGQGYVEPDPISVGGGPPQSRIFRNTQQLPQNQNPYGVTPSYPPSQYQNPDLGYSFQNINGQYINTGKK